jgi:hypothetical protein
MKFIVHKEKLLVNNEWCSKHHSQHDRLLTHLFPKTKHA